MICDTSSANDNVLDNFDQIFNEKKDNHQYTLSIKFTFKGI